MKKYEIKGCLRCPSCTKYHYDVKWDVIYLCGKRKNKPILYVNIRYMQTKGNKEEFYSGKWMPDWCPLEDWNCDCEEEEIRRSKLPEIGGYDPELDVG